VALFPRPADAQSGGGGRGGAGGAEVRIDHVGSSRAAVHGTCGAFAADARTLAARWKALHVDENSADSLQRRFACTAALLYVDALDPAHVASLYGMPAVETLTRMRRAHADDDATLSLLATLTLDLAQGPAVFDLHAELPALDSLAHAAVRAGATTPPVLRMCADVALAAADIVTARYCNQRALARGVDSTWHLIRDVWFDELDGDRKAAATAFDLAITAAHDSASVGEAAWHARLFLPADSVPAGGVIAAWSGRPDSARVAWMHARVVSAIDTSASVYSDAVAAIEGRADVHGALFAICSFEVLLNGTRFIGDDRSCRRSGEKAVQPVAVTGRVYTLWDPATGRPISFLSFALQRNALLIDTKPRGGTTAVNLMLSRWEWKSKRETDSAVAITLPVPNILPTPVYVAGVLPLEPLSGKYSWALAVRQTGRYGFISVDNLDTPSDAVPAVSDLVVGDPADHDVWRLGDDSILLAPMNTVSSHRVVELYYQIRNGETETELATKIVLRKIDAGRIDSIPVLALALPATPVRAGVTAVHRELDLSHLGVHDYHLEVQVVDGAGRVVATRTTLVLIR
jgi:hypothetical protein